MRIQFIADGNFKGWARLTLVVVGLLAMFIAYQLVPPAPFGGFLLLLGLGIAAVGGYASRAHLLKIKPFDNRYKKGRDSYKPKTDKQEGQELINQNWTCSHTVRRKGFYCTASTQRAWPSLTTFGILGTKNELARNS